jgi:hypothetical protein
VLPPHPAILLGGNLEKAEFVTWKQKCSVKRGLRIQANEIVYARQFRNIVLTFLFSPKLGPPPLSGPDLKPLSNTHTFLYLSSIRII